MAFPTRVCSSTRVTSHHKLLNFRCNACEALNHKCQSEMRSASRAQLARSGSTWRSERSISKWQASGSFGVSSQLRMFSKLFADSFVTLNGPAAQLQALRHWIVSRFDSWNVCDKHTIQLLPSCRILQSSEALGLPNQLWMGFGSAPLVPMFSHAGRCPVLCLVQLLRQLLHLPKASVPPFCRLSSPGMGLQASRSTVARSCSASSRALQGLSDVSDWCFACPACSRLACAASLPAWPAEELQVAQAIA